MPVHPIASSKRRGGRRAFRPALHHTWLSVLLLGLCLAGCGRARKKYLEQLEADWAALEQGVLATAEIDDDVPALEAFFTKYPEGHEYGNPRADQARQFLDRGYQELNRRRDLADRTVRLREALASYTPGYLFKLAASAMPGGPYADPEPLRVLTLLSDKRERLLTRGRVGASLWSIARQGSLEDLRQYVDPAIYDEETHSYDAETLGMLFAAAYLPPDTPLLGQTAEKVYPLFRPFVRAQARLYRVVAQELGAIRDYERALERGEKHYPWLDKNGELSRDGHGPLFRNDDSLYDFDVPAKDRRHFYRSVTLELGLAAKAGQAHKDFDYLDVGFWLRRFDDGTADILGRFLLRVLEGYDAAFKRELEAMEGKWPPPAPSGEPPRLPPHDGAIAAEHLVAFDPPWRGVMFDEDAEVLTVVTDWDVRHVSRDDGRVLFAKAFRPRTPVEAWLQDVVAFTPNGRVIAVKPRGASSPLVLDARTGEQVEALDDLRQVEALQLNGDATLLAAQVGYSDVAVRRLRGTAAVQPDAGLAPPAPPDASGVQQESADAGQAPAETEQVESRTFKSVGRLVGLHPDLPLLFTGSGETVTVWDLKTGKKRLEKRVKPIRAGALSPDGSTLLLSHEDCFTLMRFEARWMELTVRTVIPGPSFEEVTFRRDGELAILRSSDGMTRVLSIPRERTWELWKTRYSGGHVLGISPYTDLLLQEAEGSQGEVQIHEPITPRTFRGEFKDLRALRLLHGSFDPKEGGAPWVPTPEEKKRLEALKHFVPGRLLARPWKTLTYVDDGREKVLILTETRSASTEPTATALIGSALFSRTSYGWSEEERQTVLTELGASGVAGDWAVTLHTISHFGVLIGLSPGSSTPGTGSGSLVLLSDVPYSVSQNLSEVASIQGLGDFQWTLEPASNSGEMLPDVVLHLGKAQEEGPDAQAPASEEVRRYKFADKRYQLAR